jgi:acyl-CoA reductase-like NAD-dependent aldehyde dehydrogenase
MAAAKDAFDSWSKLRARDRGRILQRFAAFFSREAERLAEIESRDNGKLLRETSSLIRYLPEYFDYYGGLADKLGGETLHADKPDLFAFTLREPLGVVAAITPWNSPLYLISTKLAPALAAGNTVVIKPSEHASATTLELVPLLEEAGVPAGVVNVVTGLGPEVGAQLTGHPDVARVAFTGGSRSAEAVIRQTAKNFARLSLELGGKSPQIIFPDADLESAASGIVAGVFAASGQSCVAGSRLLVHEDAYDALMDLVVKRAQSIRVGDPFDPRTEVGPLAIEAQLGQIESMVATARKSGGAVLTGGTRPEHGSGGWYYTPTILADLDPQSEPAREEIFGPVVSAFTFRDEAEAVRMANDTRYGLAAGIWTRDLQRAHRLIGAVSSGIVWVNTYRMTSPTMPFGGRGRSGYGVEGGIEGLLEYTQTKSVWINTSSEPMPDPFIMR